MSLTLQPCDVYSSDFTCGICQENFLKNPKALYHKGGKKHPFHSTCVLKWIKTNRNDNGNCPSCRTPIQASIWHKDDNLPFSEDLFEATVYADLIRETANTGKALVLQAALSTANDDIPNVSFRKHTIEIAISLANANGHTHVKNILKNHLETSVAHTPS